MRQLSKILFCIVETIVLLIIVMNIIGGDSDPSDYFYVFFVLCILIVDLVKWLKNIKH